MQASDRELTDYELRRMRRQGRDPLAGLSPGQIRQIERSALAKLRRLAGTRTMENFISALRESLENRPRAEHRFLGQPSRSLAIFPETPLSDLDLTDTLETPSISDRPGRPGSNL